MNVRVQNPWDWKGRTGGLNVDVYVALGFSVQGLGFKVCVGM